MKKVINNQLLKTLFNQTRHIILCSAAGLVLGVLTTNAQAESKVTVFAAASLTNAMGEIAKAYESEQPIKVQSSYSASSNLAKQIDSGAPADIFMSADSKWMNYLQDKKRIDVATRVNLLGNRLVIIAPKGKNFKVQTDKSFNFSSAFNGRLCTGEIDSVPAGIYAKQSLVALKWWDSVKSRIIGTQDVRAAVVFVERGECDAGIVYETDAKVSNKVEIVATLPDETHEPIVYPLALVQGAKPEAKSFYEFIKSGKAKTIFIQYGFTPITTK
ncbi:MAG: molybdate ABC transporter substrate-binding protein [Methylophilaceae bacterium]|nr:molybdate ABC transporter substrate-binding protein [Methylophilaceae bacterium]